MIRMSTFLIGYRGCGKTTIGRRLADRLWQPFVDIDELIVGAAGKPIKDIFEQDGESAFRDLEEKAVAQALATADQVVALGGGSLLREANRNAIKASEQKVIYLKCEPAELHKRISADPQTAAMRPSLTHLGGNIDEIQKLLSDREPLYRQVMTAELDVTRLTPEEAIVYIVRLL
jgi:shikimate kinase